MCIQHFIKIFHIVEDLWLFHILASALPRSVKISIWQDFMGINLYSKKCQSIPKISRVMSIYANNHIWSLHCIGQGKEAFGNSLVWILSILMSIQNVIISISHMIENPRRFQ